MNDDDDVDVALFLLADIERLHKQPNRFIILKSILFPRVHVVIALDIKGRFIRFSPSLFHARSQTQCNETSVLRRSSIC